MAAARRLDRLAKAVVVLVVGLGVPACAGGGPITQANFDKITPGMTLAEVEAILGPGTETAGVGTTLPAAPPGPDLPAVPGVAGPDGKMSAKWMKWGDDKRHILIGFVNDKVAFKTSRGL